MRLSVRWSGEGWIERFERCLQAAESVRYATHDAFLGEDVLFRYGSELAMGLALLHARYLDAEVRQTRGLGWWAGVRRGRDRDRRGHVAAQWPAR